MHKCMYYQAPSYLSKMFTNRNENHDRKTGSPNELDIPKYKTTAGQRTFKYRRSRILECIGQGIIKLTANLKHFRCSLKTRLFGGNK